MYKTEYTKKAQNDLRRLDYSISGRIVKKIDFFISQKEPLKFAKKLKMGTERYRFRVGDYRVIFKIDERGNIKILMILRIKHRKDIYGL